MKRLLILGLLTLSLSACAEMNDAIIAFSTRGVDRYMDGSVVLDGESYALVWQKKDAPFAGFTAACEPINAETTRILAVAPLAKGGKCPETIFEIDAAFAETLKGGTLSLYLLDTRTTKTTLAKYVNGRPSVINAIGGAATTGEIEASGIASVQGAAVQLAATGVYSVIEQPKIRGIAVSGAKVTLTVKDMSEAADYFVVPADKLGSFKAPVEAERTGDKLTVDKDAGLFFKVIGVRKF